MALKSTPVAGFTPAKYDPSIGGSSLPPMRLSITTVISGPPCAPVLALLLGVAQMSAIATGSQFLTCVVLVDERYERWSKIVAYTFNGY